MTTYFDYEKPIKSGKVYQSPEVLKALLEFAKKPKGFLLISGKNGTGKSFAAEEIYRAYRGDPNKDDKLFISQTNLNLRWHHDLNKYGDTIPLLKSIINTDLLILDDLGTRTPSEAFMDFLYAIADKRYEMRHSSGTIITTNLNAKDMREKFSDAFFSRVGSGIVFRFEGEDRRFKEW